MIVIRNQEPSQTEGNFNSSFYRMWMPLKSVRTILDQNKVGPVVSQEVHPAWQGWKIRAEGTSLKSKTPISNILLKKTMLTEQEKINYCLKISCHVGPK